MFKIVITLRQEPLVASSQRSDSMMANIRVGPQVPSLDLMAPRNIVGPILRNSIKVGDVFQKGEFGRQKIHVTRAVKSIRITSRFRRVRARGIDADNPDLRLFQEEFTSVNMPAWKVERTNVVGCGCSKHSFSVRIFFIPPRVHHNDCSPWNSTLNFFKLLNIRHSHSIIGIGSCLLSNVNDNAWPSQPFWRNLVQFLAPVRKVVWCVYVGTLVLLELQILYSHPVQKVTI